MTADRRQMGRGTAWEGYVGAGTHVDEIDLRDPVPSPAEATAAASAALGCVIAITPLLQQLTEHLQVIVDTL